MGIEQIDFSKIKENNLRNKEENEKEIAELSCFIKKELENRGYKQAKMIVLDHYSKIQRLLILNNLDIKGVADLIDISGSVIKLGLKKVDPSWYEANIRDTRSQRIGETHRQTGKKEREIGDKEMSDQTLERLKIDRELEQIWEKIYCGKEQELLDVYGLDMVKRIIIKMGDENNPDGKKITTKMMPVVFNLETEILKEQGKMKYDDETLKEAIIRWAKI